jgi:hypothetical protein
MEDNDWFDDIFESLGDSARELAATAYIEAWMGSEVCDIICEDANFGCPMSKKFIDDLCLMMDSATFHMNQPEPNSSRIDKELQEVIKHIDSVS